MPALQLTTEQRKNLRSQAHHLDPVVMIGSEGLSPAVRKELDAALTAHGLIKVRVFSDSREQRDGAARRRGRVAGRRRRAAHRQAAGAVAAGAAQSQGARDEDRMPGPRTVRLVKFSKQPDAPADDQEGQGVRQPARHRRRHDQARQAARASVKKKALG